MRENTMQVVCHGHRLDRLRNATGCALDIQEKRLRGRFSVRFVMCPRCKSCV